MSTKVEDSENTKRVRRPASDTTSLDRLDRILLGLLAEDATRSYAELGALLHLSPPAVHDRVRRLRRGKVIRDTVVRLDPAKIGRPLLAFVEVEAGGWIKDAATAALGHLPDVEEIHSVTGGASLLLKVRTAGAEELEALLRRVYAIEGVRGTRSQVVFSTALERGPRPA